MVVAQKWHRPLGKIMAQEVHPTDAVAQPYKTRKCPARVPTIELSLSQQIAHTTTLLLGDLQWQQISFLE